MSEIQQQHQKHCRIVNERPIDAQNTIDDVTSSVSDSLSSERGKG